MAEEEKGQTPAEEPVQPTEAAAEAPVQPAEAAAEEPAQPVEAAAAEPKPAKTPKAKEAKGKGEQQGAKGKDEAKGGKGEQAKEKGGKGEQAKGEKGKGKAPAKPAEPEEKIPARLKERYRAEIVPALMKQFSYRTVMQVPRPVKVSVNMGVGAAIQDAKALEGAAKDMGLITGQKPAITRAKKSIAQFRLRKGMAVGCRVTLRGDRMYEFLDRLFSVALPRIRDFQGLAARAVDGRGNYSLGLREQLIFPEIDVEQIDRVRGMDITIVTSARTDEEARALLTMLGLPLREA